MANLIARRYTLFKKFDPIVFSEFQSDAVSALCLSETFLTDEVRKFGKLFEIFFCLGGSSRPEPVALPGDRLLHHGHLLLLHHELVSILEI